MYVKFEMQFISLSQKPWASCSVSFSFCLSPSLSLSVRLSLDTHTHRLAHRERSWLQPEPTRKGREAGPGRRMGLLSQLPPGQAPTLQVPS